MIHRRVLRVVISAVNVFLVQWIDRWGWHGIKTIESLSSGLNLTGTGKIVMVVLGLAGLLVTGGALSMINWRSRDFHLKSQRRNIRLVNLPQGKPAVAPVVTTQ